MASESVSPPQNSEAEAMLLASLNRRPASPIPAGALDPVIALYQAAAQPLPTAPTPPPGG